MARGIDDVEQSAAAIRALWSPPPRVGIILGSGVGGLADEIEIAARVDYASMPHFPRATAPGHRGTLVCGTLAGAQVVVMDGRCHGYEGYAADEVTFPVRVMRALGIELLVLSNACGGMNPNFRAGDVMIVDDQVNFTFSNPLAARGEPNPSAGRLDMSCPFDRGLIDRALSVARRGDVVAHRGVYVGVKGPSFETRAEYRFFRRLGGDAVGMSTVHEVIVARQCGLRVLALSVVTNVCLPDRLRATDAGTVLSVAAVAERKVRAIITGVIAAECRDEPAQ